jgi:hypothetical protein
VKQTTSVGVTQTTQGYVVVTYRLPGRIIIVRFGRS